MPIHTTTQAPLINHLAPNQGLFTATYTKMKSGEWGLRIQAKTRLHFSEGSVALVTKKDGSTKEELIGRVVWKDEEKMVYLATIKPASSTRTKARGERGYCAECGERITRNPQRCWETGGTCYSE